LKKETKVINLCNDSNEIKNEEVEVQHQLGNKQSMVFDTAFKIGNKVQAEAQFPELIEQDGKFGWRLSEKKITSVDSDNVQVKSEIVPLTVSSKTQVKGEVEWTEGVISALPVHVD